MKLFKGFNKDLTCRGFQYEIGKTYKEDDVQLCAKGFHAVDNPIDTLFFYPVASSRYCIVEGKSEDSERSKHVCSEMTILEEMDYNQLASAAVSDVEPTIDRATSSNKGREKIVTRNTASSVACSGVYSAVQAKKAFSVASVTGLCSMASAQDRWSVAAATNDNSIASCLESMSAAVAFGCNSVAQTKGSRSMALASGAFSLSETKGHESIACSTKYGHCHAYGSKSMAVAFCDAFAEVDDGVAVSMNGGWVKGRLGSTLILISGDTVISAKVDNSTYKDDTYYRIENGLICIHK